MSFCLQLFHTMKRYTGVFALPAWQYRVSGRADFLALWQELPVPRPERHATSHPKKSKPMVRFVLQERQIGGAMLKLNVENIGDLAIVECEGRIVRSESAFKLRDVVTSHGQAGGF